MYFQLEKICGPNLVKVYNLVNGLMFCFLAGSMIAVSATAVGIPFNMPMPSLGDMLPNSVQWIVTVGIIGAVTTIVAMFGYQYVSRFANIAAPWMILIFFAAAFAILPQLGVTSLSSFWEVANDKIWTGVALEGQSKFTFFHVMFFAWFANMAMHIGMSDLTIFRYSKKWQYGFSSATGMFIGHYFAWLAAGILYAVVLVGVVPEGQSVASYLPTLSQDALPSPAPGPLAYNAAGLAGVICVVIAGWTTANPTIYRERHCYVLR
jgi:purine-cytosine permease-like protein